jgi:[NiFe] hydrogenase diaphorase moiety large subunit
MAEKKLTKADVIFSQYPSEPYSELIKTLERSPEDLLQDILDSGLRGRGGAGFPTGLKWKFTRQVADNPKYVICNADEGEPGTFKDREILMKVPRRVFAGMAVCGHCIGSTQGFVYLRGEYKFMLPELNKELDLFHSKMKEIGKDFSIEIKLGSGAYVCGEETSLIESMEGKRGEPRNKPPFPAVNGYLDKPTVVNNVETFVNVMIISRMGVAEYQKLGTQDSRGSKLFSVSGDTPQPGVYELEMGMTVQDFVDEFGDGDTKAVQVGGAAGFCVPRREFADTIIGYEGIPTGGSMMLFNSSRSMYNVLHNYLDFFAEESCGQCSPCRVGCQQLLKGIKAVKKGSRDPEYLEELLKLSDTMKIASKCGLGQSVGNAFRAIVENYKEEIIY